MPKQDIFSDLITRKQYHVNFEMSTVYKYRKLSDIRRTKSPNLKVSRLVLQLSFPNQMKPGVKSRIKM